MEGIEKKKRFTTMLGFLRYFKKILKWTAILVLIIFLLINLIIVIRGLLNYYDYGIWTLDVQYGRAYTDMTMREYIVGGINDTEETNKKAHDDSDEIMSLLENENYISISLPQAYLIRTRKLAKMRYQKTLEMDIYYPTMEPWTIYADKHNIPFSENLTNQYNHGQNRSDFRLQLVLTIPKKCYATDFNRRIRSPLVNISSEYDSLNKYYDRFHRINGKQLYDPTLPVIYTPKNIAAEIDIIECPGEAWRSDMNCLAKVKFSDCMKGDYSFPRRLLGDWESIDKKVRLFVDSIIKSRHFVNNIEKEREDAHNDIDRGTN